MKIRLLAHKSTQNTDDGLQTFQLLPESGTLISPGWYRLDLAFNCSDNLCFGPFVKCLSEFPMEGLAITALCYPVQRGKTFAFFKTELPTTQFEITFKNASPEWKVDEAWLIPLKQSDLMKALCSTYLRSGAQRKRVPQFLLKSGKALLQRGPAKALNALRTQLIRQLRVPLEYDAWIHYFDEETSVSYSDSKVEFILHLRPDNQGQWIQSANSLSRQTYSRWQLRILAPEGFILPTECSHLQQDARVQIIRPSELAIPCPSSSWMGVLTPGNELSINALSRIAIYFQKKSITPELTPTILYTDEDWLDTSGKRMSPEFKPDWDPDYFLSFDYLSEFLVFSPTLLQSTLPNLLDDYTFRHRLMLTGIAESAEIHHLPFICGHCRSKSRPKPEKVIALINDFFKKHRPDLNPVHVEALGKGNLFRIQYPIPEPPPKASLIICTRDRIDLLKPLIDGLQNHTDYPDFEILIVDNQTTDPATLEYLRALRESGTARIICYDAPFNFAAMNNLAAKTARGSILVFLNNDLKIMRGKRGKDWLRELISHSLRTEVGAVGAKLSHACRTIQHAGVILGMGWGAGHPHRFEADFNPGYLNRLICTQNFSALTAACLAIKKELFEKVGGFNATDFSIAFNDVDLCLRLKKLGYRLIFTPYAELFHLESVSRGSDISGEKFQRFQKEVRALHDNWGEELYTDPYHNPNLSLSTEDLRLAFPPRSQP